ncbi:MAG: hypothetical protein ACYCXB_09505 [Candidatus Humimicrobiaceae bacterium]
MDRNIDINAAIRVENFSFKYIQAKRQNFNSLTYKEALKNINFTEQV